MSCLYQESPSKPAQNRLNLVQIEILDFRLYLTKFRHYIGFWMGHVWSSILKAYNFTSRRKEGALSQYVEVEVYIFNPQISFVFRNIIDKVTNLQKLGFNM